MLKWVKIPRYAFIHVLSKLGRLQNSKKCEKEKDLKLLHIAFIRYVRLQYKMNSQLNKVAAIYALVIVIAVLQGQGSPLDITDPYFGVEVPLYRIKLLRRHKSGIVSYLSHLHN